MAFHFLQRRVQPVVPHFIQSKKANTWPGLAKQYMNWLVFLFLWLHFLLYSLLPLCLQAHSSVNANTLHEHNMAHSHLGSLPRIWTLTEFKFLIKDHLLNEAYSGLFKIVLCPSLFYSVFFFQSAFNLLKYHIVCPIFTFMVQFPSPSPRSTRQGS